MKKIGLIVLVLLSYSLSCNKNEGIPGSSGFVPVDGRMYCLIDGESWKSCKSSAFSSYPESQVNWGRSDGFLSCNFVDKCNSQTSFDFGRSNIKDTGFYDLHYPYVQYTLDIAPVQTYYLADPNGHSFIHITQLDTITGKGITATFHFELLDTAGKRDIMVTDGQFHNVPIILR